MTSVSLGLLCECAILMCLAHGTDAIKCYECAYLGCGDRFNATSYYVSTVDCDGGSCLKIKAGSAFVRKCVPSGQQDFCKEDGEQAVCMCDKDLCNGSTGITFSVAAFGSLVLIATLIIRNLF